MENKAYNEEESNKNNPKFDIEIENNFQYTEGGLGWLVVATTGYCFGILIGMMNNYSLIYNEFDRVYNQTENHIVYSAWIGSVSTGVQFIFCLFGSMCVDFFNPRKTGIAGGLISALSLLACAFVKDLKLYFLTYSIGFGVGQALLLAATSAILPHYFKRRLSLANGLMNLIGAGVVIILPILTSLMLERYSLAETFYFLSGVNFVTALMAISYKPQLPDDKKESIPSRIKKSFGVKVLKKKKFVFWCACTLIGMFGYLIPIVNIDHFSINKFPDDKPYFINIVFGACSGISAIVFGKLGDITKFNRVNYHMIVFLIYGIIQILIPLASKFYILLIQIAILGVLDGIYLCFIVPISFDLAESPKLANNAIGFFYLILSPTTIAGPAFAGKIYEINKSYNVAFYVGGACCIVCSILLIFIFDIGYGLRNRNKKRNTTETKF